MIALLFSSLLLSCNQGSLEPPVNLDASQFDYYPLEIGKYIEYQVDSVLYDFTFGGLTSQDSSQTFVLETVTDTFREPSGTLVYVIERYERPSEELPWAIAQVFAASKTNTQAIRTEGNWRYLKLVFPFDRLSAWDGNLWIDKNREIEFAGERMRPFSNWSYEVDSVDVPTHMGPFAFDSTLYVTEADDTNAYEKRFSRAIYAKHVGLVWREQWILDSQYCNQSPVPADCETRPWELKAEKGYILKQRILAHN